MSPSAEVFADLCIPRLDEGKIIIDPTRFVADPDKAKRFPELPYLTVRLGYMACGHFNADIGLAIVRAGASGVLPPGLSAGVAAPSRDRIRA